MDRKFVMTALGYAILGMALGIYMAATKLTAQLPTHAHILLIGFVVSFIYGLCHKLWLDNVRTKLSVIQFYTHQIGTVGVVVGLFLLKGNYVAEATIDPVLAASSIIVLFGMILMKVLFIQSRKNT